MSDTPRTTGDGRVWPLPEHASHIQFEGCAHVVMAPEDYEALFNHARQLERELNTLKSQPVEKVCVWSRGKRNVLISPCNNGVHEFHWDAPMHNFCPHCGGRIKVEEKE